MVIPAPFPSDRSCTGRQHHLLDAIRIPHAWFGPLRLFFSARSRSLDFPVRRRAVCSGLIEYFFPSLLFEVLFPSHMIDSPAPTCGPSRPMWALSCLACFNSVFSPFSHLERILAAAGPRPQLTCELRSSHNSSLVTYRQELGAQAVSFSVGSGHGVHLSVCRDLPVFLAVLIEQTDCNQGPSRVVSFPPPLRLGPAKLCVTPFQPIRPSFFFMTALVPWPPRHPPASHVTSLFL